MRWICLGLALLLAHPARADQEERKRALPTAAAIVPGLLLHGSGHYVAGDKKTAYRLMALQGIGLGLMIVSGAALGLSGGSRYGNEITIPTLVTGTGLFINTGLADLYGSASDGRQSRFRAPPNMAASLGYAYVDDPQFSYGHFSVAEAEFHVGPWSSTPSLWVALDANNQRARLPLHYRFLDNGRGDFFAVNPALTYHHYGDDGFDCMVAEVSLGMRANLSRIGPSLTGSFVTMSAGWGLHRTTYDLPMTSADTIGILLGHFGYGLYLPKGGELEAYYKHRRDGFVAGASPSSRNGSGFLGHFGIALRQPITEHFALRLRTEIGASWLTTAGLEVRMKNRP